jgi:NAD(P)H-flavin reductase
MFNRNLYIPRAGIIKEANKTTVDSTLFKVVFKDKGADSAKEEDYQPGQFVQFSLQGSGEVPISIASSPTQKGYLELLVRKVGAVTSAIQQLELDDEIGIRGPYGTYFPLAKMPGANLIFVSGGCGLAPLRSVIHYVFDKRKKYGDISILYGARRSEDIVFKDELESWRAKGNCKVHLSVESGPSCVGCNRGVVTSLFSKLKAVAKQKILICGPSIMIHYAIEGLLKLGALEDNIFLTLERYMKCGVGKCGHCYIGSKYVCIDGPVFSYNQLSKLEVTG